MKIKGNVKLTREERNRAEWRKLFERYGLPDTVEQIEAGLKPGMRKRKSKLRTTLRLRKESKP